MRNKYLLVAAIVFLGFILRIYHVGSLPVILNRDEAALAYNALLIKDSGRDEWQKTLPITFKSFGDYKLPGYIYTLVPFFTVLGANDFVVRLPAVLAGTVLIALAYLTGKKFGLKDQFALIFSLIVALQPVFIFYSRMAWEANLALSFFVGAMLLLFRLVKNKKKRKIFDFVALILALIAVLTYNSPLILLPFAILILILQRGVKKWEAWIIPVVGLSLIFLLMNLLLMPISQQKSAITIFSDPTVWTHFVEHRQSLSGLSQIIFGNRFVYWFSIIIKNILNSFSYRFLVTGGGTHPWHNLPNQAHVFALTYVLAWIGIVSSVYFSWKRRTITPELVLSLVLIFSLAPAVITVDAPHATRSLAFFFYFSLMSVFGLKTIVNMVKKSYKTKILKFFFFVLAVSTSLWFKNYFFIYPTQQKMLLPGFDIVIQEVENKFPDKKVAVVANGYQYILAAWYLKIDAEQYFASNIRQQPDRIGLSYGQQVDDYHFIGHRDDRLEEEELLIYWDEQAQHWQLEGK